MRLGVLAIAAAVTVAACDEDKNSLLAVGNGSNASASQNIVGVAEVTFRDIGRASMTSDAIVASTLSELEALRTARAANPGAVASTNVPIQISLIAVGSFTLTPMSGQAMRFMRATYGLRNARTDSVVFDRTRDNLTFVAVGSATSIGQTAVQSLIRRDGSPANPALALQLTPTGLIADNGVGGTVDLAPEVLRTLTSSDVAKIAAPTSASKVFNYGFAVRNAPADFPQFEGNVTFAFRLPGQPMASDNPNTISVLFLIVKA